MKILSLVFTMLLFNVYTSKALNLEVVRKNYQSAVTDKSICRYMILQLEKHPESYVHLAYMGAFQTIWAKHTFNPVDKLSSFNKGKKNIDTAAKLSPNNVDIIFIRHSVQKNCPGFLGYNDNLIDDRKFLYKIRNYITSATLKSMVEELLKS